MRHALPRSSDDTEAKLPHQSEVRSVPIGAVSIRRGELLRRVISTAKSPSDACTSSLFFPPAY
jgi:hypothetical protein